MNYELAKQLKDAGFPQTSNSFWAVTKGTTPGEPSIETETGDLGCDYFAIPTLEELIEACGEDIGVLSHWPENASGKERWEATSRHIWIMKLGARNPNFDHVVYGSTPTEAVARLWLALNIEKPSCGMTCLFEAGHDGPCTTTHV